MPFALLPHVEHLRKFALSTVPDLKSVYQLKHCQVQHHFLTAANTALSTNANSVLLPESTGM